MTYPVANGTAPPSPRIFATIWVGQLISYTGSGLTNFALAVWAYETTGSTTQMALISAFIVLPTVLLSPIAGAYVDRWDRRHALILSDAGAGLSTLAIVLLLLSGHLQIWHIYLAVCASSIFGAFRWPALSASTTQLVPKKQFGRANGLLQVVQAGQVVISPVLAGVLMGRIQLQGVVLIDVVSFTFALVTLSLVRIPKLEQTAAGLAGKGSILHEMVYGWTYIRERAGLLALLVFAFSVSLFIDMASLLIVPLMLVMSSAAVLGTTLSIGGIGFLAGGAIMTAWGGPKRPIDGVLGFPILAGVFLTLIGLQSTIAAITLCLFGVLACLPLFYACNQTLWQRKVAPDVQGRVFAIRRVIILSSRLVASVAVGPLADRVFEPLLRVDGPLSASVGTIVGVGPGRGISLLFIVLGLLVAGISTAAALSPRLRSIDDELSDAVVEPSARTAPVLRVPAKS